ncbi:MAG: HNH endonuclease [Acidimicrobiales bacterium]
MSLGMLGIARSLRDALVAFDPELLSGDDCADVAEQLALTEKVCAAARALAALRAGDCGVHRRRGFAGGADWLVALARRSGTGEARAALETAGALGRCPATREALAAGELSLGQAGVITRTEAACPGSEDELVALARRSGTAKLKDVARAKRLGAIAPEDLHERQRKARTFRHWLDELGMVRLAGALPPEVGVGLMNRLDTECDRLRRAAKSEGAEEPREAHAADALATMLSGQGGGRAQRGDVVFVCDLAAYRRGHAADGEVCHIVGGGPVPVSVVQEAVDDDAFLKAVIHDGVKIETVVHFGRHIRAELRTALELGPAPAFDGVRCIDEGCGRRYGLEWDHVDPVANNGPTSMENLRPRCWPHHRDKTDRDRKAGLLGGQVAVEEEAAVPAAEAEEQPP